MTKYGYGETTKDGRKIMAHRLSWEMHNDRILPTHTTALVVQHLCHTKACVNPWHLLFSTQQANILAAVKLGRRNHKLTPADVQQIREIAAQGMPRKAIASQFGVSLATIKKVISREHWTHIL
jgi:transposase